MSPLPARPNPLALEATGSLSRDIQGDVEKLHLSIQSAERSREGWIQNQVKLLEARRGVVRKKQVPWPGANNDVVPIIDAIIRRWKPAIANLVLRSDPVAMFRTRTSSPNPEVQKRLVEGSRSTQNFYHWLFMDHMEGTKLTAYELVDLLAQHGVAYTRQGWDYRTERTSRIARVESLFPQGLEAAIQAITQQVAQQNQGLPAEAQRPPPTPEEAVAFVLSAQYGLDPGNDTRVGPMLQEATQKILNGAQYVRLFYEEVVCDKPGWQALSPLDVVVPPRSQGVHDADFVCILHRATTEEILRRANDGFFIPERAEKVADRPDTRFSQDDPGLYGISQRRNILSLEDMLDGVNDKFEEHVPRTALWEIYAKLDINGDGLRERVVIWYHPTSKTILSVTEYPYPFREWPIVEFRFEHNDKRPLSPRGIAEMVQTWQRLASRMHNARLDSIQTTLAPMFKVKMQALPAMRNVRWRPGAHIPVRRMDDIEPMVTDHRALIEFLREEQVHKEFAERYVGVFDPTLTDLGGTGPDRRTATEVDAVVSQATEVQSADAVVFQCAMQRVHQQLWNLWEEFGPEEVYFYVTGEEQPRLARRADLAGDYDIIPAGSPISTNRALILNRARELIQFLLQDPTGLVRKDELLREYLQAHDFPLAQRLVRPPEQAALLLQAQEAVEEMSNFLGEKPEIAAVP